MFFSVNKGYKLNTRTVAEMGIFGLSGVLQELGVSSRSVPIAHTEPRV